MASFEEIDNKDLVMMSFTLSGTNAASSNNYGPLLTFNRPMELIEASFTWSNISSDGMIQLTKVYDGGSIANGAGYEILISPVNTGTGANTTVWKTNVDFDQTITNGELRYQFMRGDKLLWWFVNDATGLKNLNLTLWFKPLGKGDYRI